MKGTDKKESFMFTHRYKTPLLTIVCCSFLFQGCDSTTQTSETTKPPPVTNTVTAPLNGFVKYKISDYYIYTLSDIDNDGDMDAIGDTHYNDEIDSYENNNSEFISPKKLIEGFSVKPDRVFRLDLDNDGEKDIITVINNSTYIRLYNKLSEYKGVFPKSRQINTINSNIQSVTFSDIDQDNDIDFLVTSMNDNTIVWYENDSQGFFTSHIISTDNEIAWVKNSTIVDIDSDGDFDIIVASDGNDGVFLYENNGKQTFTMHTIFEETGSEDIYPIDMDGDGDMDIVTTSNYSTHWLENKGSLAFVPHRIYGEASAYKVLASDIDQDGDVDIIECIYGTLFMFEQEGNRFNKNLIGNDCSRYIEIKDIDNDGDMDIFTNSSWYKNLL